jgi:hypothetical protein
MVHEGESDEEDHLTYEWSGKGQVHPGYEP